MKTLSLKDIRDIKRASDSAVRYSVDHSVNVFRARTDPPERMESFPLRDPDEIKALNRLSRAKLLAALNNGTVRYDAERRVMFLARLSGSE
ncbi:hypothetical protein ACF3MZ_25430 [Paenibacillaceae bacterium WGS1546]|uniref:hypothetical protein n=1 Tax=Cohnella sp. WGS1546 TaxID=3366810 RepID=UPI00372D6D92